MKILRLVVNYLIILTAPVWAGFMVWFFWFNEWGTSEGHKNCFQKGDDWFWE